jgi:hypothetical protein
MITQEEFTIIWKKWSSDICRNKLSGEIKHYRIIGELVKVY